MSYLTRQTLPALTIAAMALSAIAFAPGVGDPDGSAHLSLTAGTATVDTSEVDIRIPVGQLTDTGEVTSLDARIVLPDAAACPCPAVVWNHGFGGNKGGDSTERRIVASNGYVVLSYTSRGFGDSIGQVDLMGAKEIQDQLDAVDWLIDPENAVTGGMVIADSVGQYGASYGGFHAWALARSMHPAVRTTVPTATATQLYEAIVPGDVEMLAWANGFYATGINAGIFAQDAAPGDLDDVTGLTPDDADTSGVYDNYSQTFHRVVAEMNSGLNGADVREEMAARATKGRWGNIRIPVLIIQGINDALFPANQAVEAFETLRGQGVDAHLYLGGIGHPPAVSRGAEVDYVQTLVLDWFDHHLKDEQNRIATAAPVTVSETGYFDWKWDGAIRTSGTARGEDAVTYHLCAESQLGGSLSLDACPGVAPIVLANSAASGLEEEPVTSDYIRNDGSELGFPTEEAQRLPQIITFDAAPVAGDTVLDLAGIPSFSLEVSSAAQLPVDARGSVAAFQLDPKVYDVAPDGAATLITRGAFAQRVDAQEAGSMPRHNAAFDAFGAYYTLDAGHRLRITIATEDAPYLRPTTHPFIATVHAGSTVTMPTGAWLSHRVQVGPLLEGAAGDAASATGGHVSGMDTFGPFNR
jgi:ABC-2 type transport system ATP-binding protein